MPPLVLTKHHGLGNDFLVLLDLAGAEPVDAARAKALCDRRRGIGADGLIRVTRGTGGADLTMELRNADGGVAEMSGNGISCLAQAAIYEGAAPGPELSVMTLAGRRELTVRAETMPGIRHVTVGMGAATVTGEKDVDGDTGVLVDVGNPHLVLRDRHQDLVALGKAFSDLNVELIDVADPVLGALRMRVHERGVGLTDACGTGSVAAAAAARSLGLSERNEISVWQPGGVAEVRIEDDNQAWLTVQVQYVGRVEVP